jgi:hypothetical protein
LFFEGRPGDEMVIGFQNACGQDAYCRAVVFSWINDVRRGKEDLRNERRPERAFRYKIDAAIRSILQDDSNNRGSLVDLHKTIVSSDSDNLRMGRSMTTIGSDRV